ncbi:MAG: tetratricopeptide repeat protein [Bacteroidota bacterium]
MSYLPFSDLPFSLQKGERNGGRLGRVLFPFISFVNKRLLPDYIEELSKKEGGIPPLSIDKAWENLSAYGLLVEVFQEEGLGVHQVHPLLRWVFDDTSSSLGPYRTFYSRYGSEFYNLLNSPSADDQLTGAFWTHYEYDNLLWALQQSLKHRMPLFHLFTPLNAYYEYYDLQEERLVLAEQVFQKLTETTDLEASEEVRMEQLAITDILSYLYLARQSYSKALASFELSKKIIMSFPRTDRYERLLVNILNGKAKTLLIMGDLKQGEEVATKALSLAQKHQKEREIAVSHNNLGILYAEHNDFSRAEKHYQTAITIYRQLDEPHKTAEISMDLGRLFTLASRFDEANTQFIYAQLIFEEFEDFANLALLDQNLGSLAFAQKQYPRSHHYFVKALMYFLEVEDVRACSLIYENLGVIASRLEKFEEGWDYYQRAFQHYLSIQDKMGLARMLHYVALLEYDTGSDQYLPVLVKQVEQSFSEEDREAILVLLEFFRGQL